MKLLLHSCCGVCAAYTIKNLKNKGHEIIVYFFNPNIWPEGEYQKRKASLQRVADFHQVIFIETRGDYNNWKKSVRGLEKEPEGGKRCSVCYKIRLKQSAKKAKELGCGFFASTLTISPHKKAEIINKIGGDLGRQYGVGFYEADFKKQDGFKKTCQLADELGLFRQNYCGCEFSKR